MKKILLISLFVTLALPQPAYALRPIASAYAMRASRSKYPESLEDFEDHVKKIAREYGLHVDSETKIILYLTTNSKRSVTYKLHAHLFEHRNKNVAFVTLEVKDDDELSKIAEHVKRSEIISGLLVGAPYKNILMNYFETTKAENQTKAGIIIKEGTGYKAVTNEGIAWVEWFKKEVGEVANKRVVLEGAGGTGRPIAESLAGENPKQIIITDIDESRAEEAVASLIALGVNAVFYPPESDELYDAPAKADIVLNATGLGRDPRGDISPIQAPDKISSKAIVVDSNYMPAKNKFLADAEKNECAIYNGLGFFCMINAFHFCTFYNQMFDDGEDDITPQKVYDIFYEYATSEIGLREAKSFPPTDEAESGDLSGVSLKRKLVDKIEWKEPLSFTYDELVVFPTSYCNMHCAFCISDSPRLPIGARELDDKLIFTEERVKTLIDFVNESGIGHILFHGGGEPFLNDETIEMMLKVIRETKVKHFAVTTNALWAADAYKARSILRRIDLAMKERDPKNRVLSFELIFSLDHFHDPRGIDGAANVTADFIKNNRLLFPVSNTIAMITFHTVNSPDTIGCFNDLAEKLEDRVQKGFLNIKNLTEPIESTKNGEATFYESAIYYEYWDKGPVYLSVFDFIFRIFPVFRNERLNKHRALAEKDINRAFTQALEADIRVPANVFYVDSDGSVTLGCRNQFKSQAFVCGNIAEGFDAAKKYHQNDPLFRAMCEKGTDYVFDRLRQIAPHALDGVETRTLPYDILDNVLSDAELRLRLTFFILHDYLWDELTPASQSEILKFEKELGISFKGTSGDVLKDTTPQREISVAIEAAA